MDYGARAGWGLGTRELVDGTLSLVTDPFGRYAMGETAERVAERRGVTREDQDGLAVMSETRAGAAVEAGQPEGEIAPVSVPRSNELVSQDEHPRPDATFEELAALRPAFRADGTVTAGNASGINDASQIDVIELNQAFAAHAVAVIRALGLAEEQVNPMGARSPSVIPSGQPARSWLPV